MQINSRLGSSLTNLLILIGWKHFFSQPIIFIVIMKTYIYLIWGLKLKYLFFSVIYTLFTVDKFIVISREEKHSQISCQNARDQKRNYGVLHTDTFLVF